MATPATKHQPTPKARVRVIAIGASAGGIIGLLKLLPELPKIDNCSLLIVVHLHPSSKSLLPEVLRHCLQRSPGYWKVKPAEEGETLQPGTAYIGVPDFHLVLSGDQLHLSSTAPVHLHRPAVDALFASVAKERGPDTIAVLLSGAGCDGSDGLRLMKMSGASIIVQDPAEAMFPSMPQHGIQTGCADFIIPVRSIAPQISTLCAQG